MFLVPSLITPHSLNAELLAEGMSIWTSWRSALNDLTLSFGRSLRTKSLVQEKGLIGPCEMARANVPTILPTSG